MSSSSSEPDSRYWTTIIRPSTKLLNIPLREVLEYRELIMRLVHRDFISRYKQTVLGSLWFVLQPLFTSLIFTFVFSNIAGIPTGSIPPLLFYLSGLVCWRYFQDCVTNTAGTFIGNSNLFDKVYFPRLVVPLSQIIVNLIGFGMQFGLFFAFYVYFFLKGAPIHMSWRIIVLPMLIFQMAALGLGVGCFVSAVTTRFRDLQVLLGFFMQLWMYVSCVIYPLAEVPERYQWLYALNPMVFIIESFRFAFLGSGTVTFTQICASFVLSLIVLITGLALFNKMERTCVDLT